MARAVARRLADPRRRSRALALLRMAEPAACSGLRSSGRSRDASGASAPRRADIVLLPVLPAGRALLRRPPLPLGRARAVRDRHRRTAAAPLDHSHPRRRGYSEAAPGSLTAAGGADRLRDTV